MNVATLLDRAAHDVPSQPAIHFEDREMDYATLLNLASRFSRGLVTRGLHEGDVLAIYLESTPELVVACLGAIRIGVIPNVVNASLRPDEVRVIVPDSRAKILLTDPERWDALEPVREQLGVSQAILTAIETSRSEEEIELESFDAVLTDKGHWPETLDLPANSLACLLYTSGTTGSAKGVMLTHLNLIDNAEQFARIHYEPGDRLMIAAPLFHSWGLINGILGIIAARGTAIFARRYRTDAMLNLIEATRPTVFLGVATMINYMTKSDCFSDRDLGSLRLILCAAAPTPVELIEVMRKVWKVGYAESYGLTETGPVITTTHSSAMRPGSCGRAMGDTHLKVVDADATTVPVGTTGELWARGTAIASGYLRQPELTSQVFLADGWFRTGDIARMDEDGFVYIVDRVKDMINIGGSKVYPRDIEEVLHRHPSVADAVVVGMPDEALGEVVKAVIALKPGQQWDREGVIAYLGPLVARYKLPRCVEFVTEVPRSVSGKALRRLLR